MQKLNRGTCWKRQLYFIFPLSDMAILVYLSETRLALATFASFKLKPRIGKRTLKSFLKYPELETWDASSLVSTFERLERWTIPSLKFFFTLSKFSQSVSVYIAGYFLKNWAFLEDRFAARKWLDYRNLFVRGKSFLFTCGGFFKSSSYVTNGL